MHPEELMTQSERDLLMPFLRKLVDTRTTPGDNAANTLICSALGRQPNASYLLVQRALALECELAAAQRRINVLEGRAAAADAAPLAIDFLNLAASGWGEKENRNAPATTSKKLYDFFKDAHSSKGMDLESRAISFLDRNSRKVWLFILALTVLVVFFRDKAM
jgi:hypothetical protein